MLVFPVRAPSREKRNRNNEMRASFISSDLRDGACLLQAEPGTELRGEQKRDKKQRARNEFNVDKWVGALEADPRY